MSDREDRKLREVAVGRYGYRHEAEFAAGFLDDAGIPYRLQMNDPSMGMPLAASAVLWVHAMDAERATDILDTGGDEHPEGYSEPERDEADRDEADGDEAERDEPRRDEPAADEDAEERGVLQRSTARAPLGSAAARRALGARPRLLALAAGVALVSMAVLGALPGTLLAASAGVIGAGLSLVALLGRAPDPVRRALAMLSGDLT